MFWDPSVVEIIMTNTRVQVSLKDNNSGEGSINQVIGTLR